MRIDGYISGDRALSFEKYNSNPVVLLNHDYTRKPIGRAVCIELIENYRYKVTVELEAGIISDMVHALFGHGRISFGVGYIADEGFGGEVLEISVTLNR